MFQTITVANSNLVGVHLTKTVCFDWSAVFESFWYQKLAPVRAAAFYLVQVSGTSFVSMCHTYKEVGGSNKD